MIDIFTVLVTFLLMTAVFARITILDLDLPSADSGKAADPEFRLEVIVRKEGLELTNGTTRIATIPNVDGAYDLKTLSELAVSLKRDYPKTDSASVLLEPEVEYDNLVQVMDAIRTVDAASVPGAEELAQSESRRSPPMPSPYEWPCSRRSPSEMRHERPGPFAQQDEEQPPPPRRRGAQSDSVDRHLVGHGRVPARLFDKRRSRAERQRRRDSAIDRGVAAEAIGRGDGHQGPAVRAGRAGRQRAGDSRLNGVVCRAAARGARATDARQR